MRDDCRVELYQDFLEARDADELLRVLLATLTWEQRAIVLFGKPVMQPRLIAWGGGVPYRYSGQTLEPRPFSTEVRAVLARVCDATGFGFDHVLLNRYRDGRDSMGWHSDDETELGVDPPVATLSLGAARPFRIRARRKQSETQPTEQIAGRPRGTQASERLRTAERLALTLTHGSLLVMSGSTQRHYRHALPKVEGLDAERISLTFRRVVVL